MPFLLILALVVGGVYQLFFRYEHWVDKEHPSIVYERDNLMGETRIVHAGETVHFMSRLSGNYGESITAKSTLEPVSMAAVDENEINLSDPKTKLAAHTTPQKNDETTVIQDQREPSGMGPSPQPSGPPKPLIERNAKELIDDAKDTTKDLVKDTREVLKKTGKAIKETSKDIAPKVKQFSSDVTDSVGDAYRDAFHSRSQLTDLNGDGQRETVMIRKTDADNLYDISVRQYNKGEIFYGRGQTLEILRSKTNGWSDLALIINEHERLTFHYNQALNSYQVSH